MERIFAGEVYEALLQPNEVIFSYCKEVSEDKVLVAYKMYSLDTKTITDVAKNVYLLSKFGVNYRVALEHCDNYVTASSIVFSSGSVFVCNTDGSAFLIDADGQCVWTGELKYKGVAPSDIAVSNNTVWASYAKAGILMRYNSATLREELRIGGQNSPFDKPNNIFIDNNIAVVSCSDSNKLVRVDLDNYTVEDYKEFTETVYSYLKNKDTEFVLMESGLYVL